MTFDTYSKGITLRGEPATNVVMWPAAFARSPSACSLDEVLKGIFRREMPYGEVREDGGWLTVYCRDGAFVGISLQARDKDSIALLRKTAGTPLSTRRLYQSDPLGLNRTVSVVSTFATKGDSARHLVDEDVHISGSLMGGRTLTYYVVARTESDTVRAAQVKCSKTRAAREREDARENRRRAKAAVE